MGRAVAAAAVHAGARVTIGGRSEEKTASVAAGISAAGRAVDTTVEASVISFFEAVGEIDHLVISASSVRTGPLKDLSLADAEFTEVADILAHTLMPNPDVAALRSRVEALATAFPLYPGL